MAKILYTAKATVTGGRAEGHGRTDDGLLDVDLRIPEAMGGPGGGTNPEQLFAVGYGSCFESALQAVARRAKLEVNDVTLDASVHMSPEKGGGFVLSAELDVTLPELDDEQAADLVAKAHAVCPYSNATRGNIEVRLTANGKPVD